MSPQLIPKLSGRAGVWVSPGDVPFGDTGMTWGDAFPTKTQPFFEGHVDFNDNYDDTILTELDPREDWVTLKPKLDTVARQLAATLNYDMIPGMVQDCLWRAEGEIRAPFPGSGDCSQIGTGTFSDFTFTSRSDYPPEVASGYDYWFCNGFTEPILEGGVRIWSLQPWGWDSSVSIAPAPFHWVDGVVALELIDCGEPYIPEDLRVPVSEPTIPTVPGGIPIPPAPAGQIPFQLNAEVNYIPKGADPPPPYISMTPTSDDPNAQDFVLNIADPCEECPPVPYMVPPAPPGTPNGATIVFNSETNYVEWVEGGGGAVELEEGQISRQWFNPETGESELRQITVWVPKDGANSMKSLYNELLLILEEIAGNRKAQFVNKEIDIEITGDDSTTGVG